MTPVSAPAPPIVVDVDGTLVRTDMLLETGSRFVVAHPEQEVYLCHRIELAAAPVPPPRCRS